MKPVRKQQDAEVSEDWLVTYADAITLLLAFFVMILTLKDYDAGEREVAMAAIKENTRTRNQRLRTQICSMKVFQKTERRTGGSVFVFIHSFA